MSLKHGSEYFDQQLGTRLFIYRTDLLDDTFMWAGEEHGKVCKDDLWITGGHYNDPKKLFNNIRTEEKLIERLKCCQLVKEGETIYNGFILIGALK